MMEFFTRNWVAIHVALLVLWSSWARGGSSPSYLWALPWLSLGVVEILFLLPPRRKNESPQEAVVRQWSRFLHDPIFFIGLALLGFLTIQWLNGPLELIYDEVESVWKYTNPPQSGIPFCVDRGEAGQVLIWYLAVWVVLMAIRNAMGPRLRILLLKILVFNGALLAILGWLQMLTSPGELFWYRKMEVYFFSTFGYPNHAGAFFVLLSALNFGLFIRSLGNQESAEAHKKHPTFYGIALICNALGAYGSLCRASMVLETVLLLFGVIYALWYLRNRISKGVVVRILAVVIVLAGVGVVAMNQSRGGFVREVKTLTVKEFKDIYATDRAELTAAALEIWKDYPWTGVGGWGFRRYVGLYMPKERWKMLQQHGKANVHNDIVQFLCEHGAIGGGLMASMVVVLFVHLIMALKKQKREVEPVAGKELSAFESVSPIIVMSLIGVLMILVHSTIDLPFRSVAILLTWFMILATLPGFVVRRDMSRKEK